PRRRMVGGDADVQLPQRSTGRSSDLVYRVSAVPRAGAPAPGRHDPEVPGPAPGRLRRLDRPRIRHTHRGRPLRQADRPDHRGLIRHDRQVIPAWPATPRDILSSAQREEWSFDRCRKTPAPHPPGTEECSTSSCPAILHIGRFELDLNKTWVFDGKCALTCSCYYLVASSGCELGQSWSATTACTGNTPSLRCLQYPIEH